MPCGCGGSKKSAAKVAKTGPNAPGYTFDGPKKPEPATPAPSDKTGA